MFLLRWYRVYPVKEAIRILLNLVGTKDGVGGNVLIQFYVIMYRMEDELDKDA